MRQLHRNSKCFELIEDFIIQRESDDPVYFYSLPKSQQTLLLIALLNDETIMDPDDYYALCVPLPVMLNKYIEGKLTAQQVIEQFLGNAATHFEKFFQQEFKDISGDLMAENIVSIRYQHAY